MEISDIGTLIAERRLHVSGDLEKEVVVRIGKPEMFPDGQDYFCPFEILGAGDERIRYAAGVDAVQAIDLVLKVIAAYLQSLQREMGGTISWLDEGSEDLGFPVI